jgi:hypothetical protein
MQDFYLFLARMGNLHDCRISSLRWDQEGRWIELVFDDLYSNFAGFPEYPGREQGSIRLIGVERSVFDVEVADGLRVYEVCPSMERENTIDVKFSPTGTISVTCKKAIYPECRLA